MLGEIFTFLGGTAMRSAVQVTTLPILFASWRPERVGGQAALGALIVASFGATGITVRLIEIRHNSILRMQFFEAGYLGMNKLDIKHRQLATMTLATLALALGFSAFLVLAGPGCNRPLNSAGP